jgi:protein SCO1/2
MSLRILGLLPILWLPTLCLVCVAQAVEPGAGAAAEPERLRITTVDYRVPDLKLVRQDGRAVSLDAEMNDGRPIVLNFIFTSCGAVCPLMTQTLAQFRRELGPESSGLHVMSISIDPEEDTPARLREYARRFDDGPGWNYYTGTEAASVAAQKAFNVYLGDKMSHTAVTLLRAAPGASWRRLDGFVTPDDLVREYHGLVARR